MTVQQATAEVFLTAFKALPRREQEDILGRIARDRRLRRVPEDIADRLAIEEERGNQPARLLRDYIAERERRDSRFRGQSGHRAPRAWIDPEERIFREHRNSFICAPDFTHRARRLSERLGYRLVGERHDYIVAGHSELLSRKTRAPMTP